MTNQHILLPQVCFSTILFPQLCFLDCTPASNAEVAKGQKVKERWARYMYEYENMEQTKLNIHSHSIIAQLTFIKQGQRCV